MAKLLRSLAIKPWTHSDLCLQPLRVRYRSHTLLGREFLLDALPEALFSQDDVAGHSTNQALRNEPSRGSKMRSVILNPDFLLQLTSHTTTVLGAHFTRIWKS